MPSTLFPSPEVLMGVKGVSLLVLGGQMIVDPAGFFSSNPLVSHLYRIMRWRPVPATDDGFGLCGTLAMAFGCHYLVSAWQRSHDAAVGAVASNLFFAAVSFAGYVAGHLPDTALFFGGFDLVFATLMTASLRLHRRGGAGKKKSITDKKD